MAFLSDLKDADLETQVRMLRDEITSLKGLATSRGKKGYGDVSDALAGYYSDLSNTVTSVLPRLGKRGRQVGAAASNHPAAVAAVGLLVVGLVARLLLTRGPSGEPGKKESNIRNRAPSKAASTSGGSKRATNPRNARAGGRKPADGPMKDAAEPVADQASRSEA